MCPPGLFGSSVEWRSGGRAGNICGAFPLLPKPKNNCVGAPGAAPPIQTCDVAKCGAYSCGNSSSKSVLHIRACNPSDPQPEMLQFLTSRTMEHPTTFPCMEGPATKVGGLEGEGRAPSHAEARMLPTRRIQNSSTSAKTQTDRPAPRLHGEHGKQHANAHHQPGCDLRCR